MLLGDSKEFSHLGNFFFVFINYFAWNRQWELSIFTGSVDLVLCKGLAMIK